LADITQRAIDILAMVDVVAAEDTRHSSVLLNHLQIKANLLALHDHNEQQRADALIARVQQGQSVALISDAGPPQSATLGIIWSPVVARPGFLWCRCRAPVPPLRP